MAEPPEKKPGTEITAEHGLELLREHGYKPVVYEHPAPDLEEALKKNEPKAFVLAVRILDLISIWSGRIAAWLIVPMILALCYEVVSRYFFEAPTIWAYDITYMLYGTFFMLGAAYTLQRGGHIRTDTFYGKWSARRQGVVDSVCYLFLFPALIAFLWVSWGFFQLSWARNEAIVTSPWMPIVYPFKFVLPLTAVLLLLQGLSEFLKSVYAAVRGEWP
jgi:TRAP-type mannitol/chloroaromatic compound transport system permease small subunit